MTGQNIEIKLLDQAEVGVFQRMRLEALQYEPSAFASSFDDWQALSESQWISRMADNFVVVAFQHGEPIGMMGLLRQKPSKMAHRASLTMVYVRNEDRGSGVAVELLRMVERIALEHGISQLELSASAENPAAIRFYQREGFSQIGRIPAGFIHEGREIDDVLMFRRL